MTRLIARALRSRIIPPPWAVHFHTDRVHGDTPCFDQRCGRAPLTSD